MMKATKDPTTYRQLESTLLLEIEDIGARIRELMQEKYSLEQVLIRARQKSELVKRTDVTRRNSINRVLVEGAVLQAIKDAKKPLKAKQLFVEARAIVPSLPSGTFRSHLFRMKARGLLVQAGSGMWQLALDQSRTSKS